MSRFEGSVTDELARPIPGAQVYVFDYANKAAVVTNGTITLTQPLTTDEYGLYSFYATDGVYRAEIHYGGVLQAKDILVVGDAGTVFKGNKGDPGSPGGGYGTRSLIAARTPVALDDVYLVEAGREGKWVFKTGSYTARVTSDPRQGLYIAPSSDTTGASGAWVRVPAYPLDPRWFGAAGDGVTDDRAAFLAADALGPITIPSGSFLISSSMTLASDVVFAQGAKLVIPTGVTVTFNGSVASGPSQIFQCSGTGAVVFNWLRTNMGYAEWWGAKSDAAVDCSPGITAAIKALLKTQLLAGQYNCTSTLKMVDSHRELAGAGSKYNSVANRVTRILIADGVQFGLQLGPDAFPGSLATLQQGNTIRDVYIDRSVAPVISSACVGLQVQWCIYANIVNVKSAESMVGLRSYGNVKTFFEKCEAVRATAGTGAGTDYWRGFWADGSASIGAAGGNASIHFNYCTAGCNIAGLQTGDSAGFYLNSAFTDTFLEWPETVNCFDGIRVTGNAASGNTFSNTDLHIEHPVNDAFHNAAIRISNVAEAGSIDITSPYCGPAVGARASIWITNSQAAIDISGGQLVHGNSTAQPFLIDTATGVSVRGTMVLECANTYPAVTLSNASNCRIAPTLKNRSVTAAAAIQLSNTCAANRIEPLVLGKTSAFSLGIQCLGTLDARNEYNLSGIDSGCIAGGANNKLVRNSVQIVATGLSGSNLVSGVLT